MAAILFIYPAFSLLQQIFKCTDESTQDRICEFVVHGNCPAIIILHKIHFNCNCCCLVLIGNGVK